MSRMLLLFLLLTLTAADPAAPVWQCPDVSEPPAASCSCDLPHTLRCTGDGSALGVIARRLRGLEPPAAVSLLDVTVQDVSALPERLLERVYLHGLVVSSGEITHVPDRAFSSVRGPLQALGLPNNHLDAVPTAALAGLSFLDRLDLSHNRLYSLGTRSFKGLRNLTFLDLSDNVISSVESGTFSTVPRLQALRLRGNRLTLKVAKALRGLRRLQELDLSGNLLAGPLGEDSLPTLSALRQLQLSHNQLTSVRRGALASCCPALGSLSLAHNQVDVLEDDAFRALPALVRLDLSHNRIVAVSGSSLAHLVRLTQLDLAHNFLRSLTADLIVPLRGLLELRLDDNDITIVAKEALGQRLVLRRLTLADNPLNCDCNLEDFASWLVNSTLLPAADKATAVCATPPSLENGLLMEVSPEELLCDAEDLPPPGGPLSAAAVPVSSTQVMLRAFHYDGLGVSLVWNVQASAQPYSCDSLFVYEEMDVHEVLLESTPLRCNFSQMTDPQVLKVSLPSDGLLPGHRYRFCVVLLENGGTLTDEVALILGCSDIIPLVPTNQPQIQAQSSSRHSSTNVATLQANITSPGTMLVTIKMWDRSSIQPYCFLSVTVFVGTTLVSQQTFNCSAPSVVVRGLPEGPYRVCVTTEDYPTVGPRARCVMVTEQASVRTLGGVSMAVAAGFAALSVFLLFGLYLTTKRLFQRPKIIATHQCFLAGPQSEQQHSRYVKLQATTKL